MKYKTLFRLMLRAVGVLLFAWSAPHAIGYLLSIGLQAVKGSGGPWWWGLGSVVGILLTAVAGLYLFFGGEWVVNMAIPSNRPYCPECGYDLTGAVSHRCPECDTPYKREDVAPPGFGQRDDPA